MNVKKIAAGMFIFTLGLSAQAAVVTTTLNNVSILGNLYNVTFHQDTDGLTSFNDVFGAGSPILTFNSGNAQAATTALLDAVDALGFDVTPGSADAKAQVFLLPFEFTSTQVSVYSGWPNTADNSFVGVFGPSEVGRTSSNIKASWTTFERAYAQVPEPGSFALAALGLLALVGARRRSLTA